jgi:hypothetical protein
MIADVREIGVVFDAKIPPDPVAKGKKASGNLVNFCVR